MTVRGLLAGAALMAGLSGAVSAHAGFSAAVEAASQTEGAHADCGYNTGVPGGCKLKGATASGSVTPTGGSGPATAASATTQAVDPSHAGVHGTASASADLSTGTLHLYAADTGTSAYLGIPSFAHDSAFAQWNDTLHYTVAGAGAQTVTPITVTFTIDGAMTATGTSQDLNSSGQLSGSVGFGPAAGAFFVSGVDDFTGKLVTSTTLQALNVPTGVWTHNADYSVDTYTLTYDLLGPTGSIPVAAAASLNCGDGVICDYSHTAAFRISGPRDFSFTSDSGVFLTGLGGSTAPEPGAWALMIAGVGAVGGALRRRRGLRAA